MIVSLVRRYVPCAWMHKLFALNLTLTDTLLYCTVLYCIVLYFDLLSLFVWHVSLHACWMTSVMSFKMKRMDFCVYCTLCSIIHCTWFTMKMTFDFWRWCIAIACTAHAPVLIHCVHHLNWYRKRCRPYRDTL